MEPSIGTERCTSTLRKINESSLSARTCAHRAHAWDEAKDGSPNLCALAMLRGALARTRSPKSMLHLHDFFFYFRDRPDQIDALLTMIEDVLRRHAHRGVFSMITRGLQQAFFRHPEHH